MAAGPNAYTNYYISTGPVDGQSNIPPAKTPDGNNVVILVYLPSGLYNSYSPAVGVSNQPKDGVTLEDLQSTSGVFNAFASYSLPSNVATITASAFAGGAGSSNARGGAASAVIDPFTIPYGFSYTYTPSLDASIQLDPNSTGGVTVFAADSTVFSDVDNFADDGSPYASALWSLSLAGGGSLGGSANLTIDFEFNPAALQEISLPSSYLDALPGYSPSLSDAQLAMLIDEQEDFAVLGSLSVDDTDTATLTDFSPFPDGTIFTPYGGDVTFSDGVEAGVSSVPEPVAGMLLLLAIGAASLRRCRRSDSVSPQQPSLKPT